MEWRVLAPIVATCVGGGMISGLDSLQVGDASTADVVVPDVMDESPTCEAGTCGAPLGFQPVLFANDRATACPSASNDVVVDPHSNTSACQCACDNTPEKMCLPHALQYHIG